MDEQLQDDEGRGVMTLEGQAGQKDPSVDGRYEPPALSSYGTIEQWTHGSAAPIIQISVVI